MDQKTITVTGATGHIGLQLTRLLLSQGFTVRAFARTIENLNNLKMEGAEVVAGSLEIASDVQRAFTGADAVFAMIPPKYESPDFRAYQNKVSENLSKAIQTTGVRYVVHLSSIGAQVGERTGPINGLYDSEKRLNQLADVNIVHLRPAFFMENHLMNISLIKHQGFNGSPLRPDLSFPMIATQDIAAAAADRLGLLNFTGKIVQELLGPREYTMQETTRILGAAVGKKDLKYIQFPYGDAEKAMIGMGLSPDVARLFVEMHKGMNDGVIKAEQGRTSQSTTPTRLEDFAKIFAAAYK